MKKNMKSEKQLAAVERIMVDFSYLFQQPNLREKWVDIIDYMQRLIILREKITGIGNQSSSISLGGKNEK